MKVTIIPIVIGAFGAITKGLVKGLEDWEIRRQAVTIQTTTLRRTARELKKKLWNIQVTIIPILRPCKRTKTAVEQ